VNSGNIGCDVKQKKPSRTKIKQDSNQRTAILPAMVRRL
jgi:hypothetical protein